jgi:hypothetical protein
MSFNFLFTKDVPEDLWLEPEGLRDRELNPVYYNIIFGTLAVGINDLKDEKTVEEFYRRAYMYDATSGYGPYDVKLEDLKKCIGLTTNAPTLTLAAFKKKIFDRLSAVADQKLSRAKEVQPV